ncbi:hypothetical protein H113_00574 [Trichophyton rubrum MR1459]|uniref:Uncharacterized protein n=1 Tax=Trichophyton rubrum (strain ATCC MYA-4607 / CBS 118892) TaxID=559305 RepID=A0A080WPY4_TRIRC|nr:uncharacterized protein TERG_12655 [Trichophyton rubrum CBS 118892]EZF99855.1 hypothetical protein H113_00574 [Trichophyton rubrum MR1459]EZG10880.1 hypothetical protein H106_00450 [Trichophyton rubrum CBS 735.88]KFL62972.1 hypothetical protein TERG_12655 [Trichophyton rubrum CBS 118892]
MRLGIRSIIVFGVTQGVERALRYCLRVYVRSMFKIVSPSRLIKTSFCFSDLSMRYSGLNIASMPELDDERAIHFGWRWYFLAARRIYLLKIWRSLSERVPTGKTVRLHPWPIGSGLERERMRVRCSVLDCSLLETYSSPE